MKHATVRSSPWLRALVIGTASAAWVVACGGPQQLGGPGSVCFRTDDCQNGLACVPSAKGSSKSICSSDLSGIVSMVDGAAPDSATMGAAGETSTGGASSGGGAGTGTGTGGAPPVGGMPGGGATTQGGAGGKSATGTGGGGASSGGKNVGGQPAGGSPSGGASGGPSGGSTSGGTGNGGSGVGGDSGGSSALSGSGGS